MPSRAFISGCAGPVLTDREHDFFRDAEPWGLILFARNCVDPDQIRALVDDFRQCVGREDAPVLVDQEGGRVRRLRPPHWPDYPSAATIRSVYERDREAGERAAWLSGRLIAEDLHGLGITVDCLPVLDLAVTGADDVVGDRAYGSNPETVSRLAAAAAAGLAAGGVAPIAKHVPGHGRARADSHLELPAVDAPLAELEATDFVPFRRCADLPMAMTAHILYTAVDVRWPATLSARVVGDIIRGSIGFDGLLMTDDLSMKALSGGVGERARGAFAAGCDVALHCSGDFAEMEQVAANSAALSGRAGERAAAALAYAKREDMDVAAGRKEFASLIGDAPASVIV